MIKYLTFSLMFSVMLAAAWPAHAYAPILFFDTQFLEFMLKKVPLYVGAALIMVQWVVLHYRFKPLDGNQLAAALFFAVAATMVFAIVFAVCLVFILAETFMKPHVPSYFVGITLVYFAGVVTYVGYISKRAMLRKVLKEDEAFLAQPLLMRYVLSVNVVIFLLSSCIIGWVLFVK